MKKYLLILITLLSFNALADSEFSQDPYSISVYFKHNKTEQLIFAPFSEFTEPVLSNDNTFMHTSMPDAKSLISFHQSCQYDFYPPYALDLSISHLKPHQFSLSGYYQHTSCNGQKYSKIYTEAQSTWISEDGGYSQATIPLNEQDSIVIKAYLNMYYH